MHFFNLENVLAPTPPVVIKLVIMRRRCDFRAGESSKGREEQSIYNQTNRTHGEAYDRGRSDAGYGIFMHDRW